MKISSVCDGRLDCPAGEDEVQSRCELPEWQGCAHNEFTCEKGQAFGPDTIPRLQMQMLLFKAILLLVDGTYNNFKDNIL